MRLERGISQDEMSVLSRVPIRSYRDIENGNNGNPQIRSLIQIAIVLGLDPRKDLAQIVPPSAWEVAERIAAPAVINKSRFKR